MKFSTLLGCASMAMIVYLLAGEFSRHRASEERAAALEKAKMEMRVREAQDEARAAQEEAARAPKSTRMNWSIEEVGEVRGHVIDKTLSGVIVSCDPVRENLEWPQREMTIYGPLRAMNGELLMAAKWTPAVKVQGAVLLIEHPDQQRLATGGAVKVVAAPMDDMYPYKPKDSPEVQLHVYTMLFNVTAHGPQKTDNNWMWEKHGSLDGGAYNKRAF